MRVPVTDAFDAADQYETMEVQLPPKQIEWLKRKAEERDVSLDHVLRTLLTAEMREEANADSAPSASGDSIPRSPSEQPRPSSSPAIDDADASDEDDTPSIVESLRSASERLQDLTDEDDTPEHSSPDTLSRLRAHAENASETDDSSTDNDPGTVLMDDAPSRSMFDMMEE